MDNIKGIPLEQYSRTLMRLLLSSCFCVSPNSLLQYDRYRTWHLTGDHSETQENEYLLQVQQISSAVLNSLIHHHRQQYENVSGQGLDNPQYRESFCLNHASD